MNLAKLDIYDSTVIPGIIRIKLQKTNDPDMVDIMSEIERSNGKIYLDGRQYWYRDRYEVVTQWKDIYLELHVDDVS